MAGLVPAIHVFLSGFEFVGAQDVDPRHKAEDDGRRHGAGVLK
jgi:hypothetical protein